jgi:hypothetical protein
MVYSFSVPNAILNFTVPSCSIRSTIQSTICSTIHNCIRSITTLNLRYIMA